VKRACEERRASWGHRAAPERMECRVPLANKGPGAGQASLASRGPLETAEGRASLAPRDSRGLRAPRASRERLGQRAASGQWASRVPWGPRETGAYRVCQEAKGHPAFVGPEALPEREAWRASAVQKDHREPLVWLGPWAPPGRRENPGPPAARASLGHPVSQGGPETRGLKDPRVGRVALDLQVSRDHRVRPVPLGPRASVENEEKEVLRVLKALLDREANLELLEDKETKEKLEASAPKDPKDIVAYWVCKVCLDPLVSLETKVFPARLDLPDLPENQAKKDHPEETAEEVFKVSWVLRASVVLWEKKVKVVHLGLLVWLDLLDPLASLWVTTRRHWQLC